MVWRMQKDVFVGAGAFDGPLGKPADLPETVDKRRCLLPGRRGRRPLQLRDHFGCGASLTGLFAPVLAGVLVGRHVLDLFEDLDEIGHIFESCCPADGLDGFSLL